MPSLNDLTAQIAKAGGVAKPNKFKVFMNAAKVVSNNHWFADAGVADQGMQRRLTFFCDRAEFPSRFFATSEIRHYGPNYRQPYQSIFSDVQLQFLVGDDMKEKYFFEAWMHSIEDPITQNFSWLKDYTTDIVIEQFSEVQDAPTYYTILYDAWPIGISAMHLNYADNDQPHRLGIAFTYRRWVNDVTDVESGTAISQGTITRLKGSNDIVFKDPNS
jgi:hypothetical protein